MDPFAVGSIRAGPGAKVTGFLDVPGTPVRMPMTLVRGAAPGPVLSVTAGVHGGEYPGIEAAIRTAAWLDPKHVRGTVIIVHIVNVPAFHGRNIYICPLDGKNPNRVFPGNPNGTASERLAHTVFTEVIARSDFYIDLHGGDINEALVPFTIVVETGDPGVDDRTMGLAQAYGISYVVRGRVSGGTYAAAAQRRIPAILTEAGGQGLLDAEALQIHLRGLRNAMKHLGVVPGEPEPAGPVTVFPRFHWVTSEHAGLCYLSVTPGTRVAEGAPVGEVRDYFGRALGIVRSPANGVVIFTVTTPATNPGDPLFAVGASA
jgi:predicted deacylase